MEESTFPLIVITPEEFTVQNVCLWLPLLEAGADYLYIRGKEVNPVLQQALEDLQSQGLGSKLILSEAIRKSTRIIPGFRHVKEWERLNQEREYVPDLPYSTSVHALSELISLGPAFQLVFYSPLFPSISKKGYEPTAELFIIQEELQELKAKRSQLPKVIGLGGITAGNVKQVKQAGFDGAALLGSIWLGPDPVAALGEIKSALKN